MPLRRFGAGLFSHITGEGWPVHPRSRMLTAAFTSLSAENPQKGHSWMRTDRSLGTGSPHPEHICDVPLGSTRNTLRPAPCALSHILLLRRPSDASSYACTMRLLLLFVRRPLMLRSSITMTSALSTISLEILSILSFLRFEILRLARMCFARALPRSSVPGPDLPTFEDLSLRSSDAST